MANEGQNPPPADPGYQSIAPPYSDVLVLNAYYPIQHPSFIFVAPPAAPVARNRRLCCIYFTTTIAMTVLSGILLLQPWVRYCHLQVSLTTATADNGDADSLDSTASYYCHFRLHNCGDDCTNFQRLEDAGTIMLLLGIVSMLVLLGSGVCIVLPIFSQALRCREIISRITLVTATLLWLVGVSVYLSYFTKIKSNYSATSMKVGLILAIIIAILFVVLCILGNLAIRKLVR